MRKGRGESAMKKKNLIYISIREALPNAMNSQVDTKRVLASKVIPKASLTKNRAKQKVQPINSEKKCK